MTGLLLVSAGLLVYAYLGYPVLLALLTDLRRRPVHRTKGWPHLTVIIAARDEAPVLGRKIQSLLAQDYPRDRLQIIVVSDGSRDQTAAIARTFEPAVQVIEHTLAQGKPTALNRAAALARGQILVLTDARQPLRPGALQALVAPFGDLEVGAVTGELALMGGGALGLYRRYDDWIRRSESEIGSTVVVTGALWALRRELYTPIPFDALADDLFLPMMVVAQYRRVVCAPKAQAIDTLPSDPRDDFRRRVRTLAGAFQVLRDAPWLLRPDRNPAWFAFVSHKLLRLASPALLLALFFSSLASKTPLHATALAAQVLLYGLAAAGCFADELRGFVATAARVALAFVMVNFAVVVALVSLLRGRAAELWRPVSTRPPEPA